MRLTGLLVAALMLLASCSSERSQPSDGHDGAADAASGASPPANDASPPDVTNDSAADGPYPDAAPGTSWLLKVLTLNIHALPVLPDEGQYRAIGEVLAERRKQGDEPDLVLLQESFIPEADVLRQLAGYPHEVRGPATSTSTGKLLDSGLVVMSNHPLLASHQAEYSECATEDCVANKGLIAVELQPPGAPRPLLVLTTHMQAGGDHDGIRQSQMGEAITLLQALGFRQRASIFAGDFNSKPARKSYAYWLAETPYADAARTCLDQAGCVVSLGDEPGTEVAEGEVWQATPDRHFYFGPATAGSYEIAPESFSIRFTGRYNGVDHYSDHWGYEVRYRVTWR